MPSADNAAGGSNVATAPTPDPVSTTLVADPPSTAADSCPPTRDVIIRYVTPDLPPSAQVVGNFDVQTCQTTFDSLKGSTATDDGFCTQAAWASDNPGYDADATPAAPLKDIQVAYGPAC